MNPTQARPRLSLFAAPLFCLAAALSPGVALGQEDFDDRLPIFRGLPPDAEREPEPELYRPPKAIPFDPSTRRSTGRGGNIWKNEPNIWKRQDAPGPQSQPPRGMRPNPGVPAPPRTVPSYPEQPSRTQPPVAGYPSQPRDPAPQDESLEDAILDQYGEGRLASRFPMAERYPVQPAPGALPPRTESVPPAQRPLPNLTPAPTPPAAFPAPRKAPIFRDTTEPAETRTFPAPPPGPVIQDTPPVREEPRRMPRLTPVPDPPQTQPEPQPQSPVQRQPEPEPPQQKTFVPPPLPEPPAPEPDLSDLPIAKPVAGKFGFVTLPDYQGEIDVRGIAPGTPVEIPDPSNPDETIQFRVP